MEQFATRTKTILDRMNSVIDGKPALALRDISSRAHILVVGKRGLGRSRNAYVPLVWSH